MSGARAGEQRAKRGRSGRSEGEVGEARARKARARKANESEAIASEGDVSGVSEASGFNKNCCSFAFCRRFFGAVILIRIEQGRRLTKGVLRSRRAVENALMREDGRFGAAVRLEQQRSCYDQ